MDPAPDITASLTALSDLALTTLGPHVAASQMLRPHDGLLVLAHRQPSDHLAQVYDPVVCLVLQGAKETSTTDSSHTIEAGQFLIVTHDMPVVSRITQASPSEPYLALIASIDHGVLADLRQHAPATTVPEDHDHHALRVGDADDELVDAFTRYLRALRTPRDAEVLAPLAIREIHYRLRATRLDHQPHRTSLEVLIELSDTSPTSPNLLKLADASTVRGEAQP